MKRAMACLTIATLVGCVESSPPLSMELEYLNNDDVKSWIGMPKSKLVETWGEPSNSDQQDGLTKLSFVITNSQYEKAVSDAKTQDLQNGPKVSGIDKDMAKLIRLSFANMCTVDFTIDDTSKITEASIHRLKGANECNSAQIYNAKPNTQAHNPLPL